MASVATPPPVVTPVVSAPAPSGPVSAPAAPANATVDSVLDAAFAATPATPAPAEALPVASPETPAVDPAAPPAPPAADAPAAEPSPADAAPPELDFSEEIAPDSKSEDGKRHFYTESKSLRLQQAGKFVKAIQEIVPNATVEEIKGAIETSHAARAMILKFHEGAQNVNAIDEVIEVFKGDDNPQAFGMMAIRMLSQLAQVEPNAANFVRNQHNQGLIRDLTLQARQTTDPAVREHKVALIQNLEIALSGNPAGFRKSSEILGNTAQVDPIAAQQADINRQRLEIQQFQQNQAQQQRQAVVNATVNAQASTMNTVIDETLRPVETAYKGKPEWSTIRQEFVDAINQAESAHPEWRVKLDNLRTEVMLNGGSEQSLQNFTNYWRSIVHAIVRPNSKTILDRWGNRTVANNQAANAAARNSPPNEPAPNGAASMPQTGIKIDDALKAKGFDAVVKAIGW